MLVEEGTSFSGRSTCPGCMRPWVQFLAPVNSNSKPQNLCLRKFLVLSGASLLLGLVMPACNSSTCSGGQDRGSQLRPAWAIEWREKTDHISKSKQANKKALLPFKRQLSIPTDILSGVCVWDGELQYGFLLQAVSSLKHFSDVATRQKT